MTEKETPASSNVDETTQAQTTTEALEWHAPVLVRIDEHTTIPHLLKNAYSAAPPAPSSCARSASATPGAPSRRASSTTRCTRSPPASSREASSPATGSRS